MEYTAMLADMSASIWSELGNMIDDEKASLCDHILVSMVMAYRRLVAYYLQAKFQVFRSCGSEFSAAEIKRDAENLHEPRFMCDKCLDPYFGQIWLARLTDARPWVLKRACLDLFVRRPRVSTRGRNQGRDESISWAKSPTQEAGSEDAGLPPRTCTRLRTCSQ